jgi:hypothetical protein
MNRDVLKNLGGEIEEETILAGEAIGHPRWVALASRLSLIGL